MNVFTIPATCSFVDALADGVLVRANNDPLQLAAMTILLPNRRACRNLREAFLRKSSGKPLLLPTIRPIGDVEEDALFLGPAALDDARMPIPPLRRQLILAQYLTTAFPDRFEMAQALSMAGDLGRFLDNVHTEGLTLDNLDALYPAQYAAHWGDVLDFLKKVLRVFWPRHLARENADDPGLHRRRMIELYTQSLAEAPPTGPIIAAGSTGSIPATAELLKTVASLPNGCVVLPGLDTVLDDDSWGDLEEGHPQSGLAHLLNKMNTARRDVKLWDGCPGKSSREELISAVMRPAQSLDAWTKNPLPASAFENLSLIEGDTLDEEAASIAAIMRKHAEDRDAKDPCVLVTPDRILAIRVAQYLARWGISIDDSAGTPLSHTPNGAWLLLLADLIHEQLPPVELLAILKHPLAAGGKEWPKDLPFRTFVRLLDLHILRGPRPAPGFDGLRARLSDLDKDLRTQLASGLRALEKLFAPITIAANAPDRVRALVLLAENLAATPTMTGSQRLWSGDAGDAAADTVATILQQSDVLPDLDWAGVRAVLDAAMAQVSIRPRFGTHPRLAILGPIEGRLYQAQTMILGSLNEGTWPRVADVDGWMSRPMRRDFGLPAPERAITLSSHDFAQGLGAQKVYITRSKNRDGAPTIPSRWLQRLHAVCAASSAPDIRDHYWLAVARSLDTPDQRVPGLKRPSVNPPLNTRPRKLRVTEISALRAEPYGIYAHHVLGLKPLDPIDSEPDARDRGTLIHAALEEYPGDALKHLIAIGKKVFDNAQAHPDVTGHWWPRFLRMARALVTFESGWRNNLVHTWPEAKGSLAMGDFTLTGRADRIEQRTTGWAIIDYKSGGAPAPSAVKSGDEPQLTLLGAMLLAGAFNESIGTQINPATIDTLAYWPAGGTKDTLTPSDIKKEDLNTLCAEAREGLEKLIHAYLVDGIPYVCWPDASRKLRDDYEYAHLARIAEWSSDTAEEAA